MNILNNLPRVVAERGMNQPRVVAVGAHEGQEVPIYREFTSDITLIEPIPELAEHLRDTFPDCNVINAAIGPEPGTMKFRVMHPTNVSTLAKPQPGDRVTRTIDVEVTTLENLELLPDLLVVDAQGLELDILETTDLSRIEMVVVETCSVHDPTMASHHPEVTMYMNSKGFYIHDKWNRDYRGVHQFARGFRPEDGGSEFISDVVFVKG